MITHLQKGDIIKITKAGELFNKILFINDFSFKFYYCILLKNNLKMDGRKKLRNGSHFSNELHNCYFDRDALFYCTYQSGAYEDGFNVISRDIHIDDIM